MTSEAESLRAVFATCPDAVLLHDGARVVQVNPAFARLLGCALEALEGRALETLAPKADRASLRDWLDAGSGQSAELRFIDGGGGEKVLRLEPLRGLRGGEVELSGFVARDLTGHKRLETDLLVADRMMSIGALAAGVAHDINNPLSYVLGNIEFLREELPGATAALAPDLQRDLAEALAEAQEGAERVRRIVGDLRAFARVDPGIVRELDVLRVTESAVNMAFVEIRHRARLEKKLEPVPAVRANEARLGQIVLNLLLNAAHAMPEERKETNLIRVATRAEAGRVVIEVGDNGPGISPEIVGRVFEPFFTTKPRGIGNGLGLAMVHGVVTELGGTVEVDTALGEGTRFTVRLPPVAETLDLAGGTVTADLELAPTRVLVVDDDPLISSTLRRVLEREGHAVEAVDGGERAIARLREDADYDVVFCDLLMPERTGMEVHAWAASHAPELAERFAFMSGGVFTTPVKRFLDAVNNPVIDKPFDVELVCRVVRRVARGLRGPEVLGRESPSAPRTT